MRTSIAIFLTLIVAVTSRKLNMTDLDNTLINETLFSPLYNKSVEWGIYKPDLWLGLKNRQDKPLSIGMFWYYNNGSAENEDIIVNYPYVMDQGVVAYYQFNDASSSSRQIINDTRNNMVFTVDFYKELEENDTSPGSYISRWSLKVNITRYNTSLIDMKGTPVFFIAKEGKLNDENGYFESKQNEAKNFFKISHGVGSGVYESVEIGSDKNIEEKSLIGIATEENMAWQLDKIWLQYYQEFLNKSGFINTTQPNVIMVKPTKVEDSQTVFLRYSKQTFASKADSDAYSEVMNQTYSQVIADFDSLLQNAKGAFDAKFDRVFGEGYKDFLSTMPDSQQFAKEVLSNLLSGISYFYGPIRIKDESDPTGKSWYYDDPAGLFTATPSRPYFPRGFLWDEGFHSQLTCQWQKMMCMDIISHWIYTMKVDGWIPREQMRGKEAESNLNWSLIEDPQAGNPPSFMFVLTYLLNITVTQSDQRIVSFLDNVFPRVEVWFRYFNSTLANDLPGLQGTYMWMDVYAEGALSSGLDDYPRGYRQSQIANVHQDLMGWMILFSRFMGNTIDYLEKILKKPVSKYTSQEYKDLSNLIYDQMYRWCYDDYTGFLTDRIIYDQPDLLSSQETFTSRILSDKYERLSGPNKKYSQISKFSAHKGIINLFPVAFGLLNDTDKLDNALRFAVDTEEMFSPYGLRGVSKKDEQYLPGIGYWRGPVWISVNYLVLRGLHQFYMDYVPSKPLRDDGTITNAKDLYLQLRKNIVQTVYDNWVPEHLIYENFNDVTGQGQYSHPFTGWSTLVLLILSERYI